MISHNYRSHFKANLHLAAPIMVGQAGQLVVNFVDNVMVGKLGAVPLAAISLSIAVYISLFVAGMGLSFALPPLVAAAHGKNKTREISQYFKHSLVVNIVFAFLCVFIVEAIIPYLGYLGQDPEVVQEAIPYLRISAWTTIPFMIFQTFRCYADGMSQTKPAMIAILIGNVFNVGLNYMLIFGKLGAPALGVSGAAIGTLLSRSIMVITLLYILRYHEDLWNHLRNARYNIYKSSLFNKVLKLGIPTSLQMFFEVSAFGGAAILMGTLGAQAQAAHQIAINLASITFLICTGLGMTATIRVGNHQGKNDVHGSRDSGFSAMLQATLFMAVCAIIFVIFRWQLPTIYIENSDVISIAASLLLLAALFQISDGIQVVALGALRGLQDVKMPMLITFVAYWIIGLPTSYLTIQYLGWGPQGIWWGLVLGLSISAVMLTIRFHFKTAQKQA